ncbi:hypothetical protein [Burkholderia ubonensis]|uniref:hypothetical protein n=1 Tax=Burkholderia ubonensis TaxID=101571 RepID=UPI0012F71B9F|nr:hypothetical protein [Burkholderia ubonensis]
MEKKELAKASRLLTHMRNFAVAFANGGKPDQVLGAFDQASDAMTVLIKVIEAQQKEIEALKAKLRRQ